MKSKPEILDEIMFYILERTECEEDTDKYLDHVLDYFKKDYQQAYEKKTDQYLTYEDIQAIPKNQTFDFLL